MGWQDDVPHPAHWDRNSSLEAVPFDGSDEVSFSAFVAEQTISYLQRAKTAPAQPFLCIAGFYSPHSPWVAPQRFLDMYERDELSVPEFPPDFEVGTEFRPEQLRTARHGYYAMISEVDYHVGLILQSLEELQLAEETIVVFTSDHGEWLGEHGKWGKGYPGPDLVSRVPLMIRVPGASAGRRVSNIVEAVDVVPTLLECAGYQIPPEVQGQSLMPLVTGSEGYTKADAMMEMRGWKSLRNARFRYVSEADGSEHLWDLEAEFGQYRDISADPAYASALSEMRGRLLQRVIQNEAPLARTWTY